MGSGVIVELQGSRERFEDLLGGMLIAALLEADVVVAADSGQHRNLLATQPRHPTVAAELRHADVLGLDQLTAGAKVLADQVLTRH
jgi:hypothetical protein